MEKEKPWTLYCLGWAFLKAHSPFFIDSPFWGKKAENPFIFIIIRPEQSPTIVIIIIIIITFYQLPFTTQTPSWAFQGDPFNYLENFLR